MTTSWLHAAAAGLWLSVVAPQTPAQAPPTEAQSPTQDPDSEVEQGEGTPWAPVVVACLGVVVGAWLARRQIQSWKQRGG